MFTIVVRDTPQPQGSKRAFALRKAGVPTGQAVVVDDNKPGLRNWRESVRAEVQKVMDGRSPLEGPVVLAVTFTVPKPKSAPKRRVTWPEKKPDLDKLLRSVCDGLKSGGAYGDDAQVVEIVRLGKFYPELQDSGTVCIRKYATAMLAMAGTDADVLSSPGAVIRVASVHEFSGVNGGPSDH
jgi:Holliday junction resolvase RusA-like endonuclease